MDTRFFRDGEKVCFIVGAAEFCADGFSPLPGDFIIAADGGYSSLERIGIKPDLTLGDFDSLGSPPAGGNVLRLPAEKDDTDTHMAAKVGLERGCKRFFIYGGTGGLFSHTLANIQTLAMIAESGGRGFLISAGFLITAVKDGILTLPPQKSGRVSVFALGDKAEGVFLSGLKYPLTNAVMTSAFPVGVSNEFKGENAYIEVKKGTLIAVIEK